MVFFYFFALLSRHEKCTMNCLFSAVIGCHFKKKCFNMTGIKTFTTTVIPINEHKLTLNWQTLKFLCDKLQIMCDTGVITNTVTMNSR